MKIYIVSAGYKYYPTRDDIKFVTSSKEKANRKHDELRNTKSDVHDSFLYDWVKTKTVDLVE